MVDMKVDKENILGRGGTAVVFGGKWGNVDVAIKRIQVLSLDKSTNREEEIMKSFINVDNVLQLLDVQQDNDFKYLILELCVATVEQYCQGIEGEFRNHMPSNPKALYQMANGLRNVHLKVAHRDISTGNVLIKFNGRDEAVMVISDFGFCKPVSETGSFSISKGAKNTEHYVAAELLEQHENNRKNPQHDAIKVRGTIKSDIFSLGCVFFRFLTKDGHPFLNNNSDSTYFSININVLANTYWLDRLDCDHSYAKSMIEKMIQKDVTTRMELEDVMAELKKTLLN